MSSRETPEVWPSQSEVLGVDEVAARLDELHGSIVWVAGVLSLEFEGQELRGERARLWFEFAPDGVKTSGLATHAYDRRQVVCRGRIDKTDSGHFEGWPGAVVGVDRMCRPKELERLAPIEGG